MLHHRFHPTLTVGLTMVDQEKETTLPFAAQCHAGRTTTWEAQVRHAIIHGPTGKTVVRWGAVVSTHGTYPSRAQARRAALAALMGTG